MTVNMASSNSPPTLSTERRNATGVQTVEGEAAVAHSAAASRPSAAVTVQSDHIFHKGFVETQFRHESAPDDGTSPL